MAVLPVRGGDGRGPGETRVDKETGVGGRLAESVRSQTCLVWNSASPSCRDSVFQGRLFSVDSPVK